MTTTTAPVAVVMVGGRGERLRPLTDQTPKPLLHIGGRAIVERILGNLAAAGVADVWLTVNYLADRFEEQIGDGSALGVRVHYVREDEPLGTAGALSLLPTGEITGPVIVTNGDLVTDLDFAELVREHARTGAAITVCGVEHDTQVLYGVLHSDDGRLESIEEKPFRTDLVNAGMYVVDPALLEAVPAGRIFGMPDLIQTALDRGLLVHVHRITGTWHDIGNLDEFYRVSRQYEQEESTS
jgi:NDP-sugar pyrophosphorylase family protein